MKFTPQLEFALVAHETADELAVMLELEAHTVAPDEDRPAATLQVVLDRSGSMSGAPLQQAVDALVDLVARLDARDNFGVVVFDDTARVVVPAGPVTDRTGIVQQLRSIRSGGLTDVSAGIGRGLREIRRLGVARSTLLLVSDGHANRGVVDHDVLASLAAKARGHGVMLSTIGLGEAYDESLLVAVTRSGGGNHVFAEGAEQAAVAIASEADGLLEKAIEGASLTITCGPEVQLLRVYNDLPGHQVAPGAVMLDVGDLYSGEQRKLLLRLAIPGLADLGLAQVATLELSYVELPGLVEHSITQPLHVNVVPGDQASGRVADPVVRSEVLFQEAQDDKLRGSEALERGDVEVAKQAFSAARGKLEQAGRDVDDDLRRDLAAELGAVEAMDRSIDVAGPAYASKMSRASFYESRYKRGRRDR